MKSFGNWKKLKLVLQFGDPKAVFFYVGKTYDNPRCCTPQLLADML